MVLNAIRFMSVVLTAVAMAGAFAHLFELPNKINLPREDYLTVQRLYRGWALLGNTQEADQESWFHTGATPNLAAATLVPPR